MRNNQKGKRCLNYYTIKVLKINSGEWLDSLQEQGKVVYQLTFPVES